MVIIFCMNDKFIIRFCVYRNFLVYSFYIEDFVVFWYEFVLWCMEEGYGEKRRNKYS